MTHEETHACSVCVPFGSTKHWPATPLQLYVVGGGCFVMFANGSKAALHPSLHSSGTG